MVQWLRLHASTAGGMGSIPGQGTKIPHALRHGQKKKKKRQFVTHRFQEEGHNTTCTMQGHPGKHQGQSGGRGNEKNVGKSLYCGFCQKEW